MDAGGEAPLSVGKHRLVPRGRAEAGLFEALRR